MQDGCRIWGVENQVKWQRNINITNFPHAWFSQAWGEGRGESYTLFQTLPNSLCCYGICYLLYHISLLRSEIQYGYISVGLLRQLTE